jgi:hypothetical protein
MVYMCVQVFNHFSLFIHRLKINHKSCWSYAFILEEGAAANIDSEIVTAQS